MDLSFSSPAFTKAQKTKWKALAKPVGYSLLLLVEMGFDKDFEEYLNCEYFGHDEPKLIGLYLKLVSKAKQGYNKPVRIADLLNQLFGRNRYDKDGRVLVAMMKRLPGIVEEYLAIRSVRDIPVNKYAIATDYIRNTGYPYMYRRLVSNWVKQTKRLPVGRRRIYHDWTATDADYFSTEADKSRTDGTKHTVAYQAWKLFAAYQDDLHKIVLANRQTLVGEEAPTLPDALSRLSTARQSLEGEAPLDYANYVTFKKLLLASITDLPPLDLFNYLTLIQNKLLRLKREQPHCDAQYQLYEWTAFIMENELYLYAPGFRKGFYLNQVHQALVYEDFELANKLIEAIGGIIPVEHREMGDFLAQIAIAFYSYNYVVVARAIPRVTHQKKGKDPYVDQLRLKTYQLRSCLCLYARDPTWQVNSELAVVDYEKHLERSEAGLSRTLYQELEAYVEVCHRIITAITENSLSVLVPALRQRVCSAPTLHAREWLLNYLDQIDPARPTYLTTIRPSSIITQMAITAGAGERGR